jgi:hypothetical protein
MYLHTDPEYDEVERTPGVQLPRARVYRVEGVERVGRAHHVTDLNINRVSTVNIYTFLWMNDESLFYTGGLIWLWTEGQWLATRIYIHVMQ